MIISRVQLSKTGETLLWNMGTAIRIISNPHAKHAVIKIDKRIQISTFGFHVGAVSSLEKTARECGCRGKMPFRQAFAGCFYRIAKIDERVKSIMFQVQPHEEASSDLCSASARVHHSGLMCVLSGSLFKTALSNE
jgi:hypothetical protein